MDAETKIAVVAAVNTLITSPNAHELYASLEAAGKVPTQYPVSLRGEAAVFNELLDLRRADPGAYERVIDLAEQRRETFGFDALRHAVPPGYNKVSYQREFMAQKRDRQRVAAEIENTVRPERDRLIGNARLEFMRRQSMRWKEQRDAFLQRARDAHGGRLSVGQIQTILTQFWSAVDADLEARLKQAKLGLNSTTAQKRGDGVTLESLEAALRFDPYQK